MYLIKKLLKSFLVLVEEFFWLSLILLYLVIIIKLSDIVLLYKMLLFLICFLIMIMLYLFSNYFANNIMKRMYFLKCCNKLVQSWFIYKCGRSGYKVTLFPARATLFDSYELARTAQKHFPMFEIKFVDICL